MSEIINGRYVHGGYVAPAPVTCVHVDCAGKVCRYIPPALGPELPRVIETPDGMKWTRHGTLFCGPNNGAEANVTSWKGLRSIGRETP